MHYIYRYQFYKTFSSTGSDVVIINVLSQVLLPLIDQYFKNHSLYFLSSPNKNLSSSGYASNKEKEMVTRCKNKTVSFTYSFEA